LCQVEAAASTADSGFRLCVFVLCPDGTSLPACAAGNLTTSPVGLVGCCTTAPGQVIADHECVGTVTDDDSADVYVRIDQASACVDYTVDYHF
jgi:hypothetical protein